MESVCEVPLDSKIEIPIRRGRCWSRLTAGDACGMRRAFASGVGALVFLVLSARAVVGQQLPFDMPVPLDGVESYATDVPLPDSLLGHRIGHRHTRPHQAVEYFRAVAGSTDRVVVQSHGRTHEGRLLIHAIVTSPANHARLDAIREANAALSDDPAAGGETGIERMPAIAYLAYSVHGNEASGTEAAMLLLYHLAAGNGPAVSSILDSTIVIIDPMLNPDGRDRFVDWVNGYRGAVATGDPEDREHREEWPYGRTNHFLFDLNRDWLPAVHPEAQARLALFHRWRPQLVADFHEMSSDATFFFQPGIPSRVNPHTPPDNQELTGQIAGYHAAKLDRIGSLYYTRETFDDFYYGKGSTYPDVNGAVGILYEQASSRGLLQETPTGPLTYEFTIRNQFSASLSTLEAVAALRTKLLSYQRKFYTDATERSRHSAYLIRAEGRETSARQLVGLLKRHRIRANVLARSVVADGVEFIAGRDYVLPLSQAQSRLAEALFEPRTTFKDSLFYDVSAWSLPMAFDLQVRRVDSDADGLLGPPVGERTEPLDLPGRSAYAYLLEWGPLYAARALHRLQSDDIQVRVAMKPFEASTLAGVRPFGRGTMIVPVFEDPAYGDRVYELIRTIAAEDEVPVFAASTGLSVSGPDFGSPNTQAMQPRAIGIVSGRGTSVSGVGEAWYTLSAEYQMPVSLIDADRLDETDLARYDVIVLPSGTYGASHAEALRPWIEVDGGHLVTLSSASVWAAGQGLIDVDTTSVDVDSLAREATFEDAKLVRDAQRISGAILQVRLDETHPIAFGTRATMPVFRTHAVFFSRSRTPGATVAVYDSDSLLDGYLPGEAAALIPGTASIIARRLGEGRVVAFADDPVFRGFWRGTWRVFMNAVMLSALF